MSDKLTTISIGIPVYNEEGNIKKLLQSLLSQEVSSGVVIEVIVVADCPYDNTVSEVKSVNSRLVNLVELKKRQGVANAQNVIVEKAQGDILVMLDGDVLPHNEHFIEEIIKPIMKDSKVGLVSGEIYFTKPESFIEKTITVGHIFRNKVFLKINNADNIYLCHGCARAFSRDFYKKIKWPDKFAEDAYSYLFCKMSGFKFMFTDKAIVLLKSPAILKDHLKQSIRFTTGKKGLAEIFSSEVIKKAYKVPFNLVLTQLLVGILKNPITLTSYMLITLYSRIASIKSKPSDHALIDPPSSTKNVATNI